MQITAFCKYHPKDLANWTCHKCKISFCINCISDNAEHFSPHCTLCRGTLSSLSIADQIPPFWKKLTFFFSFPFCKTALSVIFLYAFSVSLLPDGKIGMVLSFLILFPVTEFLFELMEQVANGEKISSDLKRFFKTENKAMFMKMLLTYAFIVVLITKSNIVFGSVSAYLLSAFFVLGIPASLIILMIEKSNFSMVNPVKIVFIIKSFGLSYLLLYLIIFIAFLLSVEFGTMASSASFPAKFIVNSFSIYLVLVVFSMMGYLVFQHHHELNYRIRGQDLQQSLKPKQVNKMLEVEIFLQEGRFEDAQKILLNKIDKNPMDYKASEKLILLYSLQGKDAHMSKIATTYFSTLIDKNKQQQAADFYFLLFNQSIQYIPESSLLAIALASQMSNKQQHQAALFLINSYSCQPSEEKHWDQIAFLKAKLLAEFLQDNRQAIDLLNIIIKRSVQQSLLGLAEKYLKILSI